MSDGVMRLQVDHASGLVVDLMRELTDSEAGQVVGRLLRFLGFGEGRTEPEWLYALWEWADTTDEAPWPGDLSTSLNETDWCGLENEQLTLAKLVTLSLQFLQQGADMRPQALMAAEAAAAAAAVVEGIRNGGDPERAVFEVIAALYGRRV